MKFSTKVRYGTRTLLDLALHDKEGLVLLKDIAARQEISVMYLEQVIKPLVAAGIIRTTRGPKGGISLAKSPQEIRLSEVVQVLEGSVAPVECVDDSGVCPRSESCVTRDVWNDVKKAISGVLESTTLQDLVERQKDKPRTGEAMYQI